MNISWTGDAGEWDDAGNWTPAQIPGAGDDVVISGAGIDVFTSSGAADAARTVTISADGGAVTLDGSLSLAGAGAALTVQAGAFQIDQTGTLSGGVLSNPGGTIFYEGGTVVGITYDGVMDVTGGSVVISGGLTLAGAGGTGPGELDVGPEGVAFLGGQTISGGVVDLGSQGRLYGGADAATSQSLTLAAGVTLKIRDGDSINLDAVGSGPLGLVNEGTIAVYGNFASISGGSVFNSGTVNVSGGYFDLYGDITNSGAINVSSGATVDVYGPSLTNTVGGAITVDHGGLNFAVSDVINDGVITVDSGSVTLTVGADSHYGDLTITNSSIGLYGSVTTGQFLGWLAGNSDYVGVLGTLINTGAAFGGGAAPTYAIGSMNQKATVVGGTLVGNGGDSGITNAELDGVTINGQMDLGGAALIVGSLGFTSQNGVDPGGLKIFDASTLTLQGSQTLGGGKLELAGIQSDVLDDISPADYAANGNAGAPQTLTLGSGMVIDQTGTLGALGGGGNEFGLVDLVNHGLIEAEAGVLLVQGTASFESDGKILAATGGVLTVQGTTLENSGAVEVDAGSTLNIQTLDNTGSVQLDGGALNAQNLTGPGTVKGFGQLTLASGLSGAVEASGGELDVLKANASAVMTIDAAASLKLAGPSAGTVNFAGDGTLVLTQPDAFTGTIGALADGASIDLAGLSTFGQAIIDGNQVSVLTDDGAYLTLNFASDPNAFRISDDGAGGTLLTYVDGQTVTTVTGNQTTVQHFDPSFSQITATATTVDPGVTTVQQFFGDNWDQTAATRTYAEPDGGSVVERFGPDWNFTGGTVTTHPDADTTVVQQFDKGWDQISATYTTVDGGVTTVQDFDGAWNQTGATRTAVNGNQTVEQMFNGAWSQTGATVITDYGADVVTQTYDANWTQLGAEDVTVLPGQVQDALFDGSWNLLSKVETADGTGAKTWFDFGRTVAETFSGAADHATTFVFSPGQVDGDTFSSLHTFAAGGALHDVLDFTGYGPGATLTQASATTWTLASTGHASETFTVAAGTVLAPGDYMFG